MFLLAFAALSAIQIVALLVWLIFVVVAIAFYDDVDKFNGLALTGCVVFLAYCCYLSSGSESFSISATLSTVGHTLSMGVFWEYLTGYIVCGVIYFFPQMWVTIRKAARKYAENPTVYYKYKFMQTVIVDNSTATTPATYEPIINKTSLTYWMTSWVVYWPFYLINLIVGDLLKEVARWVVDKMHGRLSAYVKNAFAAAMK